MNADKKCGIILLVVQAWYRLRSEELTAEKLAEVLAVLNRESRAKFGRPLLDMEFVVWLDGVYSKELLDALERCADAGVIEYAVEVSLPFTPHTEEEYALLKDAFDEVDIRRIRKVVRPKVDASMRPKLRAILDDVGMSEEELEKLIDVALNSRLDLRGREVGEQIA